MSGGLAAERGGMLSSGPRPESGGTEVDDADGPAREGTDRGSSRAELEQLSRPDPDIHPPSPPPSGGLSFEEFYRQHTAGLVAFVMWLGAGAAEAADIAQVTMIRAWQGWARIEHPRTWVRKVASREYLRRIAACHEEPAAEPGDLLRPGADGVEEAVMLGPQQAGVLELLRRLPARQRQVVAWIYDGYTPAEVAEILGLAPGAVRASLHKARESLRHYLTGEGRS